MLKKLHRFLALAALVALPAMASAQDELLVANGSTTNRYIPIYGYYTDANQHNQVIYPADSIEDMLGGTISGLTFYLSQVNSDPWDITVTISLGTTTAADLASGLDATTSLTQVWQGTVNGQTNELSFLFDNEFIYDGDNLLIDIQTVTSGEYSDSYFYGVSLSNASRYTYTTSYGSQTNYSQNFLPKTKFEYTPGGNSICRKPKSLVFAAITNNGADVSWTAPVDGASEYAIFVDGAYETSVTDTFYTLTGLSANTDHLVQVKNVCDDGDSSGFLSGTFRTLCQNGNCEVQVIPSAYYSSSSYMPHARIYQNGTLLADANTNTSVDICSGDSLIVIYGAPQYNSSPNLRIVDFTGTELFNGTANTGDTVVAVANGCPTCIPPTAVRQTPNDAFSTVIAWSDPNFDPSNEYIVEVDGIQYPVSGDTVYDLSTYPLTRYSVRVARLCDGDDTSYWRTLTFSAPCDESVYAPVPFSSGFEELVTSESPDCWVQVATGTNTNLNPHPVFPSAYVHAPNAHNSRVYFEFESNQGETEILALPRMEDVSTLQLSFYAVTTYSTNGFLFEAGVIETDDQGEYTFVPVDTVDIIASNNFSGGYHVYNVLFDTYQGEGDRLAIKVSPVGNPTIYTLMIDDFNVIRVGVPVLGPFASNAYSVNIGDTLSLDANLMSGDVDSYTWTSPMLESGLAEIVSQDTTNVLIVYSAAGSDLLTVTASNANGEASRSVLVTVIDNSLVSSFPYSTGFEDGDDCSWYTANSFNGWYIGSATAYEGSNSLYISRDNGASNLMADGLTGQSYAYRHVEVPASGEYTLSFMWKAAGTAGSRYMRAYIADSVVHPVAGSSPSSEWTLIGSECVSSSSWTQFAAPFTMLEGQHTIILYWYGTGNQNPPVAVDNISIDINTCPTPVSLSLVDASESSLTIGWTALGDEGSWLLTVGDAEPIEVSENPYPITDLDENVEYTVSLRAYCAPGDTSFALSGTFRTTCAPVSAIPWTETFATNENVTCWTTLDLDAYTSSNWNYSSGYMRSGANYNANANDWLISPAIVLPDDAEGLVVSWDAYGSSYSSYGSHLRVLLSTSGMDTASFTTELASIDAGAWTNYTAPIDNLAGQTVRIAFVHDSYNDNGVQVRNVQIRSALVPVVSVQGPGLTDINVPVVMRAVLHEGASPVTYSWSSSLGVTPVAAADSAVFTYTATGTDTVTLIASNAHGADTAVAVIRVYDFAPAVMPFSEDFETSAANWLLSNGTNGWYIGPAESNGGSNGLYISNDGGLTNGYNNAAATYSFASRYVSFDSAGTYTLSVDWKVNGENNYDFVRIFLAQPVELVGGTNAPAGMSNPASSIPDGWIALTDNYLCGQSSWQTHSRIFTLPSDGTWQLVVMWRNDGSQGSAPVALDNLSIVAGGVLPPTPTPCAAPSITSVVPSATSVLLNYSGSAASYEVHIVQGTWDGPAAGIATSATSYTFSNLTPSTYYTVGVRAVCDNGVSDWVFEEVTTLAAGADTSCLVPSALHTVSVDSTSATIAWTAGATESLWQLMVNDDLNHLVMANATTYVLSNLAPSTAYRVRVRAYCSATNQSAWSDEMTFTTTASGVGIDGVDENGIALFPNPATTMLNVSVSEPAVVTIVDISGREVLRTSVQSHSVIDLADLAQGTYFVRFSGEHLNAVRKLLVR